MITCCHKFLPECFTCNCAGLFSHPAVSSCFTCTCAGLFSYRFVQLYTLLFLPVSTVIVPVCSTSMLSYFYSCLACNCAGFFNYPTVSSCLTLTVPVYSSTVRTYVYSCFTNNCAGLVSEYAVIRLFLFHL